ncbi:MULTISPECIES: ABC transporter substrate-binding protein [Rhizobium/Agrobacterium group]|uniref:ABC transporter substrate-binding protein n=1 Tax=Rhizobium/Agrobacterium group TaxID=227290 RepID=UPI001ADD1EF0|nr:MULTISPECIES: ABC transporter substrate-binding protein [Rhizobium/Agrobacterium group]MBO9112676.1 ABC transporter substrate-binding protein [Agrobacterium sp. S2/73]QXZ76166.1 ABC transporter substrate-binding protein [Agrobacterium sp. S7/73]QYA17285.1 ABC transporter substrate-binding protein [Rhizobium sp. AB2/73]UEQ85598.1 ABC transporter substrate-binding protein [Rhizobium sp. AB2/73]
MSVKKSALKVALLASVLGVAYSAEAEDIKLGFNGDLSASPSAQSGRAGVLGIQAAIDDINAAGGLLGQKLQLVVRDDLSQPPKSIQNMSDLIDNEKVTATFGTTNSGNALAWKHIPNQRKNPNMECIGSGSDITKSTGADNYIYRVSMVDRSQVAGLIAYVKNRSQTNKVGFMVETTGYGQGALKDLQSFASKKGIEPAAVEKFGVNDTDMTSQLEKLRSAGVDTVIIWAQGTPIAQVIRSMQKIDYWPVTLASWAADNASFYDTAGKELAEKPIFIRTITEERTPAQQKLYDRLSPKLASKSSFSFSAHCYDATLLLAAAIRQANSADGAKIHDALDNLQAPVEGVMKTYNKPFSVDQREALTAADYRWTQWRDGKLVSFTDDTIKALKPADFAE